MPTLYGQAPDARVYTTRRANNGTVTGTSPAFVSEAGQDYHLTAASQAVNTGTVLNPAVLPDNDVVREYVKHLSSVARAVHSGLDIGAYEF